jgi:hypothetical protein
MEFSPFTELSFQLQNSYRGKQQKIWACEAVRVLVLAFAEANNAEVFAAQRERLSFR